LDDVNELAMHIDSRERTTKPAPMKQTPNVDIINVLPVGKKNPRQTIDCDWAFKGLRGYDRDYGRMMVMNL